MDARLDAMTAIASTAFPRVQPSPRGRTIQTVERYEDIEDKTAPLNIKFFAAPPSLLAQTTAPPTLATLVTPATPATLATLAPVRPSTDMLLFPDDEFVTGEGTAPLSSYSASVLAQELAKTAALPPGQFATATGATNLGSTAAFDETTAFTASTASTVSTASTASTMTTAQILVIAIAICTALMLCFVLVGVASSAASPSSSSSPASLI